MATAVQTLVAAGITITCLGASVAAADPVAEFYKGRTFTILVGQEPGTGYDIYGRVLARHLGRHIPGNPTIVVQNMPGASGINAGNWLYSIAAKDGAVIGTFTPNVIVEPLLGNAMAKYDPARFLWVGNMEEGASVCALTPAAGVTSFQDLRAKEVIVGATGPTGPLGQAARALNAIMETKFKIIYGYKGSASVKLAIQKGEVHGVCGLTWSTIKSFWKDELDAGRVKPVLQTSARRQADLAGVAHIDDYVKAEDTRQMLDLIFGTMVLGRVFAAPPGVPADRALALRAAFMAAMRDKELLADATKTHIDIIASSGEEVEAMVKRFHAVPPAIVERVKQVLQ